MSKTSSGTVPAVSVAAGRKGSEAGLGGLRERMRSLGFSNDEIAAEIGRRYQVRPREAYRLAWGWTLKHAATLLNERIARHDADTGTRADLTGSQLGEVEKWPRSTCKPSADVLFMLAEIYQTDVLCLLDLADHESLPQQDRLVLLRRPRAATPFAEKVIALMEARGLSAAQTARRVSCSAGYLSNVIHGRKRPSRRVAARLDDLLEAGGELVALAETAEVVTDDDESAARGNPRQASDTRAVVTEGMSLSLPYVPGRLVIEVSGPAATTGDSGDAGEIVSGRLALVRDRTSSSPGRKEATSR